MDKPAIDFFDGALLGNGGMGVCVTTRPDGVAFHFGHNNVWDIRIAEDNREKIGTFDEIMSRAKALSPDLKTINDDKAFDEYLNMSQQNYRKSYPRPFPCGTVVLGFDRREAELLGHSLDIADGLCRIFFLHKGERKILEVFTDMEKDVLWFRLVNENGEMQPSFFDRLRIIPDPTTPKEFPAYKLIDEKSLLGFTQVLPYLEPNKYDPAKGHPKDKAFCLEARLSLSLTGGVHYNTLGIAEPLHKLEKYIIKDQTPFTGCIVLSEGLATDLKTGRMETPAAAVNQYNDSRERSVRSWEAYWKLSYIDLADTFLEEIWYRNQYFMNCAASENAVCPGLFANWSLRDIGTAWHGDYHMNYNTQQPFWLPFSSNRLSKNLPYVNMVYHILPVSRQWAKEYYHMRGAFFPHSAYPVDMTLHPYPKPDWGWEVFETPWSVQGLWWHYIYSMDEDFLRDRAYVPIKDATLFLVDYMKRSDAHGTQWKDNKYHIFPSVPPELYGLQPGFKFNYDTQIDITMTRFLFKAFIEAANVLKYNKQEAELLKDVKEILNNLPDYSTAESEYGTIYTSVPGENDKMVYNCPANLTHIFPGEEYGIDAPADVYDKLVNTFRAHQNEGGNDIVFLNLQAVRLGILDIERFKRQVHYATLPNQTVADMVLQRGGRYDDMSKYDFMAPMGIWFENFALPVVINECLLQSYNGRIRLFPNWDKNTDAAFSTLRAVGAFLVSCKLSGGQIRELTILSEKGKPCTVVNPWGESATVTLIRNGKPAETLQGNLITFKTAVNELIELRLRV
jgi:hypothetical protein